MMALFKKIPYAFEIALVLLLIASAGATATGYLLKKSYERNGEMSNTIAQLERDNRECHERYTIIINGKDSAIKALENTISGYRDITDAFKNDIERLENKKRCVSEKKDETIPPSSIVDDIDDTFRMLERARCRANGGCVDS